MTKNSIIHYKRRCRIELIKEFGDCDPVDGEEAGRRIMFLEEKLLGWDRDTRHWRDLRRLKNLRHKVLAITDTVTDGKYLHDTLYEEGFEDDSYEYQKSRKFKSAEDEACVYVEDYEWVRDSV